MSKVYDSREGHQWVFVNHPKCPQTGEANAPLWDDEGWKSIFRIVLHTGNYVWIEGGYSIEGHPEVVIVKDGRGEFYDDAGNCILSVPAAWCTDFYTDEDANQIEQARAADEKMRGSW